MIQNEHVSSFKIVFVVGFTAHIVLFATQLSLYRRSGILIEKKSNDALGIVVQAKTYLIIDWIFTTNKLNKSGHVKVYSE